MGIGSFRSAHAEVEFDAAYAAGMRTLPEPREIRELPTDFGTVRAYRFGAERGEPLVLLPGRAGTTVSWRPNIAAFAEHHPVYALDLLGEPGRSVQTAPIRSAADQAAWLGAALVSLDLPRVHLVGVSIGGWLATNLAVRAPQLLASVTCSAPRSFRSSFTGGRCDARSLIASVSLLDPANTFGRLTVGVMLRATGAILPLISRWTQPAFLRWISGGAPIPVDDPVVGVINAGMRDYRIRLPAPEYFTDEQLRSIQVPVLAIIGGRSVVHHAEAAYARARTMVPGIQAELWPEATHSLSGECATQVNARVLAFISEHSS